MSRARIVGPGRGERGDAGPLEMVILMPVLLLAFALVVLFGRTTTAATDVEHAARVAARAAAAAQSVGGAQSRAATVAAESLASSGLACVDRSVSVSGSVQPGGRITVTVRCRVSQADVTRYGFIPGSRTLSATASEVVDVNRGGGR